jgi:5-methylcytosine-specific restriction endonuclease McrA
MPKKKIPSPLKSLSDQQLHAVALSRGKRVREQQAKLVEVLAETIRRKSYLHHGDSIHAYLESVLGLPRTTAYHYAQAAYLALDVPEVIGQLASGELSVYLVSRAAKAIKDQERPKPKKAAPSLQSSLVEPEATPHSTVGKREIRQILNSIAGKKQVEAERELAERFGSTATRPTSKRVVESRRSTRLEFSLSDEELALWDRMIDLMAHRESDPKAALMRAVDTWLEKNDPVRIEERSLKRQKAKREKVTGRKEDEQERGAKSVAPTTAGKGATMKVKNPSKASAMGRNRNPTERASQGRKPRVKGRPLSQSKQSSLFRIEHAPEQSPGNSRPRNDDPTPEQNKRFAFTRDKGACQYPIEGGTEICGRTHGVDIDHIRPRSEGGGNEVENLRVLCRAHNRNRHWIE